MRFLILSTATGQGHNSAALAVKECLETRGFEAEILDVLSLRKPGVSQNVSRLYANVTIHSPKFFGTLYRVGQACSHPGGHSPVYLLNALYARQLCGSICTRRPDALICTHIFSAQAVTCLMRRYGLRLPCAGVATDYTCIPFWEESALDGYIIPSAELFAEFAARGIPAEKLRPIGIPVRQQFLHRLPRREARAELGLPLSGRLFLVMGGSMGYGDITALVNGLLSAVPDSRVAALCGRNEALFCALDGKKRVIPLRYTETVGLYMDAADVVLTKPGGISSTEAISKRVPLVLTRPIPGCEQRNASFLAAHGAAAFANGTEHAVAEACRLAIDRDAAAAMLSAQESAFPAGTNDRAADYLIALASGRL